MNGGLFKMIHTQLENQELDSEWVALIMNAKTKGFSKEDIRKVLLLLKESSNDDEPTETAV